MKAYANQGRCTSRAIDEVVIVPIHVLSFAGEFTCFFVAVLRRLLPRKVRALAILALLCHVDMAQAEVQFRCPTQFAALQRELPGYLRTLQIPAEHVVQTLDAQSGVLMLALATPLEDTRTLDFFTRPEFSLTMERVSLPTAKGKLRAVSTVSRKEILLALLQHGRMTEFKDDGCSLEALADHVGVRQNIVAWAENLDLVWPDGGSAKWNSKYWTRGTPNRGVSLYVAFMDVFLHQDKYTIGCYTAVKLIVVQGMLDYYWRVKPDPMRARRVEKALLVDGDPLVGIEPGSMWSFEADFDMLDMKRPGKLLSLHTNVPSGNFVPGDWGYMLNTDATTYQKTGYEGSNAIYLGHNRFSDYYNDHRHSYTYEQKLDEVYQWRNGVFSRSRDAKKIKPLSPDERTRLGSIPADGGIQLDIRVVPRHF